MPGKEPGKEPKRSHGQGTIEPLKSGSFRWKRMIDGQLHYNTVESREKAQEDLDALDAYLVAQKTAVGFNPTVEEHLRRYYQEIVVPHRSEGTRQARKSHLDNHLIPELGSFRLRDLRRDQIQSFMNQKQNASNGKDGTLSPRYQRGIWCSLHNALKYAIIWGHLTQNPADLIEMPANPKSEIQPFTRDEWERFLVAARELNGTIGGAAPLNNPAFRRYHLLYELAFKRGLRLGELLALDRSDFKEKRDPKSGMDRWWVHVRGTKTESSNRKLPLPPSVVPVMTEHFALLSAEILKAGGKEKWPGGDALFLSSRGTRASEQTLFHHFKLTLKHAGLPEINFHQSRHTAACQWLRDGVPIQIVSRYLGHANIGITLSTYIHILESELLDWSERMDADYPQDYPQTEVKQG